MQKHHQNLNMNNILFLGTELDEKYVSFLKPLTSSASATFVIIQEIQYLTQVVDYCKRKNVDKIITTSAAFLYKLVEKDWPAGMKKKPSINDYAGSLFSLTDGSGNFIADVLIVDPLKQCFTKTYGKFILARNVSKLTKPGEWYEPTAFTFSISKSVQELSDAYDDLSNAFAIAIDIETVRTYGAIACAGYCGAFKDSNGNITTRSYVIPFDSSIALSYIRKINSLPCEKIFQNGKYDNFYFLRWNAPVTNWLWDTAHLFHSWYSELPKDLGFLNAFHLRKVQYWKDLANVGDKYLYYKYNALDAWATMNVWMVQMKEMPVWARRNYTLEFPVVFPCLLSEGTGLRRHPGKHRIAFDARTNELAGYQNSLNRILGVAYFNTNSSPQMDALFKVLGLSKFAEVSKKNSDGEYVDKESYADPILEKAKLAHPFGGRIIGIIQKIRELRKELSTYLVMEDEFKTLRDGTVKQTKYKAEFERTSVGAASESGISKPDGRILYSLNPHGTDTTRLASRESALWCGFNVQNGPREGPYKSTISAEDGFLLAECDLKQAESRDTANISGDKNLLAALDSENDFHAWNASAFFGVQYELIFDNKTMKTLNKKLRDLSKRTNHGANYNMGPAMMLETMGEEKVAEAKKLLGLPVGYSLIRVCEFLLERFHATYPAIARVFYPYVIRSVLESRLLTSRVVHWVDRTSTEKAREISLQHGDWTRYCFGNPDKSKRDLNSYVAHVPQSLNARTLNESYLRVFYELALGNSEFRLYAQIHDSILFGFRKGTHARYCSGVRERMQIPVTINSCDGVRRTFTVPADIKSGKLGIGAEFWSETE